MDLVRIFHVVDTPSSGKHDINYIYVVGLIVSILIHLESVLFDSVHIGFSFSSGVFIQCSCFGMVIAGCSKNIGLCHPFLTVCFLSVFIGTWCCSVFNGIVWFPVLHLAFKDDHDVDHPVVVYTENVYIEAYIHQHLNIHIFCSNLSVSIYNHNLNVNTSPKKFFFKIGVGGFKSPKITFINLLIWDKNIINSNMTSFTLIGLTISLVVAL